MSQDLISQLVGATEVNIEYSMNVMVPHYDEENHTIYLSGMENSTPARFVKWFTGRPTDYQWSLAHELGHAVFATFKVDDAETRRAFGKFNLPYSGAEIYYQMLLPGDDAYITTYAQTHPEEDWADTFAYVCLNYNNLNLKGMSPELKHKVKIVKEWIKAILESEGE